MIEVSWVRLIVGLAAAGLVGFFLGFLMGRTAVIEEYAALAIKEYAALRAREREAFERL